MWSAGLDESQAEIKMTGRKYQRLQICRWHHPKGRKELKSLLTRVKTESEKVGLKFNIQKTKIMVSGLITSQIDGEKVETVTDFSFTWAPKSLQMVTAATKLKTPALWKKSYDKPMTNLY